MRSLIKFVISLTICVFLGFGLLYGCMALYKYDEDHADERAADRQQEMINSTHVYEVLNAFQYVKTDTNGYGGIRNQDIVIGFTYLDSNGTMKTVDYWYGDVIISDSDKYEICDSSYLADCYQKLYLTKETIAKMQLNQNQ